MPQCVHPATLSYHQVVHGCLLFTIPHNSNLNAPVCRLLLQFLSRPFVAGDSITVQSTRHVIVSGTVERITPLRTLMRTDDDVLVTVPNKVRPTCYNIVTHSWVEVLHLRL
jgi:hypothetical protein